MSDFFLENKIHNLLKLRSEEQFEAVAINNVRGEDILHT